MNEKTKKKIYNTGKTWDPRTYEWQKLNYYNVLRNLQRPNTANLGLIHTKNISTREIKSDFNSLIY